MGNAKTDTTRPSAGGGPLSAVISDDDIALDSLAKLEGLPTASPSLKERLSGGLQRATVPFLKVLLQSQIAQLRTTAALMVSAELTARGIAPCLRGLPFEREQQHRIACSEPAMTLAQFQELESDGCIVVFDNEQPQSVTGEPLVITAVDFILLAADLQWIAAGPKSAKMWERAERIFDPKQFDKTARYLHYDGRRAPGQVAKAMGLSEQQQRECAWIQCLHIERWRDRLIPRLAVAKHRVEAVVRTSDKRSTADQDATIKRRGELWLCAEFAEWKPQRTADLYLMMTGEKLPRNVVAKQLEKLPNVSQTDTHLPVMGDAQEL